ncbi:MAG: hypothetical protein ABI905_11310 [Betaproteobacteria bacterium]
MTRAITSLIALVIGPLLGYRVWLGLSNRSFWPEWASGDVGLLVWIVISVIAIYGLVRDADARLRRNIGTIGE